ncbi:hypothetical protein QUB47_28340 [Microcoleus sp. AT9_B5]
MNAITVASIAGHDPKKVLFDRYAGLMGKPEAPEIFYFRRSLSPF